MKNKTSSKNIIYLEYVFVWATAMLLMTVALWISGLMPGGRLSFINDSAKQVIPISRMYLEHLMSGRSLYYSHEMGMGVRTALSYAFYSMSPVNYILLFIRDDQLALCMLIILKTGLSTLFMYVFLRKHLRSELVPAVVLALSWGFSTYQLNMFQNICLSDTVWLLPLLMCALFVFIKDGSFTILSASYALCFITHFYSGFLIGVFSFGVFVAYIILRYKKAEKKKFVDLIMGYAAAVLTSVLISMAVIFPVLCIYTENGGDIFNKQIHERNIDLVGILVSFFWGRGNAACEDIPALYCGLIPFICAPVYFVNKRIPLKEKIATAAGITILLLSFAIDPLYDMWHMFNRPDGYTARFSLLLDFICIFAASRTLTEREMDETDRGRHYYELFFAAAAAILPILFVYSKISGIQSFSKVMFIVCGNLLFIILWAGVVFLLPRIKKSKGTFVALGVIVFVLSAGECVSNAVNYYSQMEIMDTSERIEKDRIAREKIVAGSGNINGNLYRTELTGTFDNQGALYGFPSDTIFSSSVYNDMLMAMYRLGRQMMIFSLSPQGGTDLTDMLLAVGNRDGVFVDKTLPIGFMADEKILEVDRTSLSIDPFVNQNLLVSSLLGEETEVYVETTDRTIVPVDLNHVIYSDGSGAFQNTDEINVGGETISIPKNGYSKAYIYFTRSVSGDSVKLLGSADETSYVELLSDSDRKGNGVRNIAGALSILEMEDGGNDDFRVRLIDYDENDTLFSYTGMFTAYQDEEAIDAVYNKLASGGWRENYCSDDCISATVSVQSDRQVLFMSIPYDRNFKMYVDGKETVIQPAFAGAFSAVKLSAGEHDIMLIYDAEGRLAGTVCFVTGIILLIILSVVEILRKKN